MTKMCSIIFIIMFFFIMVLCAFQPICFANALDKEQDYRLSIVDTDVICGFEQPVYLKLDYETKLTPRYLVENPDYHIRIKSSNNVRYRVDVKVGNKIITLIDITYSDLDYSYSDFNAQNNIDNYVSLYGDDFLDSQIYLIPYEDTIFTVSSSWNYQVPLLNRLLMVGEHIFIGSKNVANMIVKTPLLLITFGLSFLAFVIAIVKRIVMVG